MADSISEAEKVLWLFRHTKISANRSQIRNKRLAKLGLQNASQTGKTTDGNGEGASAPAVGKVNAQSVETIEEKEPQKSKISISKTSKTSQNPFSQLGVRSSGEGSQINIAQASNQPMTPTKRDRPSSASGGFSPKSAESLGTWENKALAGIFRLTLDQNINRDSHGNHIYFVGGVRSDLEDQNEPVTLSVAVLDQAILEAASALEKITPLDYLLGCWKRVSRQLRALKGANTGDPKYGIIKEARRLCMSYCIFAVTMPDMFG